MKTLLVVGHPHSGTTWLCRTLASACDGATPVGGGSKHPWGGVWRVIRTHSGPSDAMLVGVDKVLLTKRDPRDVAQSLINRHPHRPPEKIVRDLCFQWPATIDRWRPLADAETNYETMRADGVAELQRLAAELFEIELSEDGALVALGDYTTSREPRGVGAWHDDLDPALAAKIGEELGEKLDLEGY